ncbi:G patch domain and ankyrin repeat-containing protein 1 [Thalassophryne amazonica]|uniref:G patch domain and ankyrin repeat-containing protein 1 n=1 Tax=Thalassophryne amazonica TaxID=390379 RepID=UPI00147257B2|nr:G patch domain and ankyrin repeat-containing protein 1 [Thalassophryne amazonica]
MAALGFTPASEQDIFRIETNRQSRFETKTILSGEEARQFYENLTKDDTQEDDTGTSQGANKSTNANNGQKYRKSNGRVRRQIGADETHQVQAGDLVERGVRSEDIHRRDVTIRQSIISERSVELQGLRLLRCAHEGDITRLKDLLSKGADINFQDNFFWTAVMCASWSGQRAAVRMLLQRGAAWVGVVDMQGRDAKDLALAAGHSGVLEEFENYGRSTKKPRYRSNPQRLWCDVCCNHFSGRLSSHLSSTLHQFSLRRPPPTPHYCLPPSSASYKMMVRCGWKPGTGLGPEGVGPNQPVPTVLKRDQGGLGYGQTKRPKVTHFLARDYDAVKQPSKEMREGREQRKQETKQREEKGWNWERDFRTSFYL